ncbi:phosphatase PTC7 -like protein [Brachionus plicatilis]|uniref:Protein phosphatase n=1 Tax=Brachionus plicatilis TaxID=10195 RepID=A0A3M7T9Y0_BRAPC|nr:phosphatase PTC7 -like protein [Brachionus plicatilis]
MQSCNLNDLFENLLKLSALNKSEEIKLKFINRTNSNTSCNSDSASSSGLESGYLSSNDSFLNLIPHRSYSIPTITYGYFGKAKTQNPSDTSSSVKTVQSNGGLSTIDSINHGDDCGFILSKQTIRADTEENMYFLGLADGVSANRLRGYDAKLFPIALLENCANYLAKNDTNAHFDQEAISDEFLKNNNFLFFDQQLNDEVEENESDEWQEQSLDNTEYIFDNFNTDNELEMNNDFMYDQNANESFKKYSFMNNDCKFLYKTLADSHQKTIEKNVYGSSTVCLMALKFVNDLEDIAENEMSNFLPNYFDGFNSPKTALLSTCNIGDSGYMIIRDKNVIYKSATQTHRFNAPYQLGCTPPELLDHDLYRDTSDDSLCQTHEIKSGDFILLSSDGLFDNLYEDEIALIIDNHIQSSFLQSSFDNLNDEAKKTVISSSSSISSELLSSACELLVQKAENAGIKRDDMLIILAYVN